KPWTQEGLLFVLDRRLDDGLPRGALRLQRALGARACLDGAAVFLLQLPASRLGSGPLRLKPLPERPDLLLVAALLVLEDLFETLDPAGAAGRLRGGRRRLLRDGGPRLAGRRGFGCGPELRVNLEFLQPVTDLPAPVVKSLLLRDLRGGVIRIGKQACSQVPGILPVVGEQEERERFATDEGDQGGNRRGEGGGIKGQHEVRPRERPPQEGCLPGRKLLLQAKLLLQVLPDERGLGKAPAQVLPRVAQEILAWSPLQRPAQCLPGLRRDRNGIEHRSRFLAYRGRVKRTPARTSLDLARTRLWRARSEDRKSTRLNSSH